METKIKSVDINIRKPKILWKNYGLKESRK